MSQLIDSDRALLSQNEDYPFLNLQESFVENSNRPGDFQRVWKINITGAVDSYWENQVRFSIQGALQCELNFLSVSISFFL
jgi:hypothetical protein